MNKPNLDIQKIQFPILRFERNYFKIRFPINYNMSFVSGLVQGGICLNFPNFRKEKMENMISSACLKKSILLSIFFSIRV